VLDDGLKAHAETDPTKGRWPANLIHDGSDEVMEAFAAFGEKKTGGPGVTKRNDNSPVYSGPASSADRETVGYADTGTAARFFYCAKASKADRDAGLEGMPKQYAARDNGFSDKLSDTKEPRANTHPTVKPTALMRYLCRLITPPGGTILDPFMGSGSTGRGALLEGFSFVGIEMSPDYIAIAEKRIADAARSVEPADLLDMMEVA
jgi:site-specific DNA-methyltransferase (adenine-specific)